MKAENHFLSSNSEQIVAQQPTNKTSSKFNFGFPDNVVFHFMAGRNASPSARTLTDFNVQVSAHLVMSQGNSITQLESLDTVAWHAGKGSWGIQKGLDTNSTVKKSRKFILYVDREDDDPNAYESDQGLVPIESVTAYQLNASRELTVKGELLTERLCKGRKVKIIEAKGKWGKVLIEQEGWVNANNSKA